MTRAWIHYYPWKVSISASVLSIQHRVPVPTTRRRHCEEATYRVTLTRCLGGSRASRGLKQREKDWRTYGGRPRNQRPWNRPCRGRVRVLNFWSRPPPEEEEVAAALPREPRRAVGFEGFGGFAFGFWFFAGAAVREMPLNCWSFFFFVGGWTKSML